MKPILISCVASLLSAAGAVAVYHAVQQCSAEAAVEVKPTRAAPTKAPEPDEPVAREVERLASSEAGVPSQVDRAGDDVNGDSAGDFTSAPPSEVVTNAKAAAEVEQRIDFNELDQRLQSLIELLDRFNARLESQRTGSAGRAGATPAGPSQGGEP